MMRTTFLLVACLAACSKPKDTKDKPTPTEAAKPTEVAAPAAPAAPWQLDPAAIAAKLQGAWVVKDAGWLGSVEAWEVSGDKVKVWDAKKQTETVERLTIDAPCQYSLHEGSSSTTGHFVLEGDTLHLGLGDAGVKQGDKIIACMSNGVFVQDAGGCKFYLDAFGKWEEKAGTCGLTGDKFKASNTDFHFDGEMVLHGSVLASDQLWNGKPVKVASYDEAKAKATAAAQAKP